MVTLSQSRSLQQITENEYNNNQTLKSSLSHGGTRSQSVTFIEYAEDKPNRKSSPVVNQREVQRILAVRIIERAWSSYRDRKMFLLLRNATCAAENSLSYEILRKVAPKEAQLLKDKGMPVKVRFRFGGEEFPPMVYFKIYSDTTMTRVKYISGKKAIKPASIAAQEACDQMGKRKFMEIVTQDAMSHEAYKITDEMDITTLKDYMQYLSHIDELPSNMGGRDNFWRKLTLDVIPRQTIFYDIVDFLYHRKMTDRLKEEMPSLVKSPMDRFVQLRHIEIITKMASFAKIPKSAYHPSSKDQVTARRSRQARNRVQRMRRTFDSRTTASEPVEPVDDQIPSDEEELDMEADKLFQWTQELSFEELDRAPSMQM